MDRWEFEADDVLSLVEDTFHGQEVFKAERIKNEFGSHLTDIVIQKLKIGRKMVFPVNYFLLKVEVGRKEG
ncbi:hypothetical protein NIES267_15740 [Calothrix parasitica NIES-267]|uniref:Uncharacterized protein n=1 Tax=Calothrix parasitica NIES-267 TaxID=1973488 RepID=A0A1Z4LLJ8_9CYAN|nr:hypothetical protein NIES267_15740 [Calothrix parasitica NIES-267]